MQKISKYGTFKFKDFSRTFKGLEFFLHNSRTSNDPMNPGLNDAFCWHSHSLYGLVKKNWNLPL